MYVRQYLKLNNLSIIRTKTNPATNKEHVIYSVKLIDKIRSSFEYQICVNYRKEPVKSGICIYLGKVDENLF